MGNKKDSKKKNQKRSTKSVSKPQSSGGKNPKWYEWILIVLLIVCGIGSILVGPVLMR